MQSLTERFTSALHALHVDWSVVPLVKLRSTKFSRTPVVPGMIHFPSSQRPDNNSLHESSN
jgi:hypothetical protein